MAAMSNYLSNKLCDLYFRGISFSFPSTMYLAAYTVNPTYNTSGTEVTGTSYARVSVASNTTNWSSTNSSSGTQNPSSGTSQTSYDLVQFAFPSAGSNWGTITGLALFDASTSGNMFVTERPKIGHL